MPTSILTAVSSGSATTQRVLADDALALAAALAELQPPDAVLFAATPLTPMSARGPIPLGGVPVGAAINN
ncbi:MAG: hypothetical protein ACI8UD_003771 [Planctomycetota bacterium]|jgi:hypothetical protein